MDQEKPRLLVLLMNQFGYDTYSTTSVGRLRRLFDDPFFVVQVPPSEFGVDSEYTITLNALRFAAIGQWSHLPCLLIGVSSLTYLNGKILKERLAPVLDSIAQPDLIYLCRWQDDCRKSRAVDGMPDLVWSIAPTATQAIIYSTTARNILLSTPLDNQIDTYGTLLNQLIQAGNLSAVAFTPNLVNYDSRSATSDTDFNNLNVCASLDVAMAESFNYLPYIWILVVGVVVGLLIYAVIVLSQPGRLR
jgi:hypothetical protein